MNVIRVPEEEEKADQAKKAIEEIILKTSQIWQKTYTYRVKKLNKSQAEETKKKTTPRHSIIKLLTPKDKEKTLESNEREMTSHHPNGTGFLRSGTVFSSAGKRAVNAEPSRVTPSLMGGGKPRSSHMKGMKKESWSIRKEEGTPTTFLSIRKNMGKHRTLFSPLEFSKLFLIVKASYSTV